MVRAAWMTALLLSVTAVTAACTASSAPDRAVVPGQRPVVLTMANALTDPEQLSSFTSEVSALTGGTVRIDVRSHWRPGQVGYESGLIADVRAGKADLGAVSSRALDSAGVLSMQALGAPLLITSYAAEEAVLASPVTSRLLGALGPAGLTGIGILPGDLFHPDGAAGPLVKPSDYAGRSIGIQQSSVADATLRALGAQPEAFPVGGTIGRFDGVVQAIRSIHGFQYDTSARFLTTNVVWWPRPLVLFGTEKALGKLTPAQRQELRQAAVAALPGSMRVVRGDEQEAAQDLCRAGGIIVETAAPGDLAALRAAVAPVYARLERDPATRSAIRAISAVVGGVTAEAPPSCARRAPAAAGRALLDGVYTKDTKFGDDPTDPSPAPENYGHWVFVLHGTHFAHTQQYRGACTWAYGTLNVTGSRIEMTYTDGGGIAPTGAENKPGEFFVFGWSLYRDTLRLTVIPGAVSPAGFVQLPWHRATATPSFSYFAKDCPPPADALG